MMKKLCAILAAVFMLSLFAPLQAAASNASVGAAPDGYIVKLKTPEQPRKRDLALA